MHLLGGNDKLISSNFISSSNVAVPKQFADLTKPADAHTHTWEGQENGGKFQGSDIRPPEVATLYRVPMPPC